MRVPREERENVMLARRIRAVPESVTLALNARARALKAKGVDVASFAAGELDFAPPDVVRRALVEALDRGDTRYTDAVGTLDLRRAIAEKLERDQGLRYAPEDIVVSCGAKHSIYNVMQVLCDPGDEVLIPSPYWLSYPEMARLAEAEPRFVACDPETFRVAPDALARALTPRTRLVILNSPANPTGAVYGREELRALGEVLLAHPRVTVVSDEIYEKLVYGGARHESIAVLVPALRDRTIVVNGLSKSYAMTGLRLGYAAGPREVMAAMGRLQSHSTSNPTSIVQAAAAAALRSGDAALAPWLGELEARRARIIEGLRALRGVRLTAPAGAFYAFPDISGLFGAELGGRRIHSSFDLSEAALEAARVVLVPGEPFGSASHVRLAFATSREEIEKGLARLAELLGKRS
jgi:aspartate aminotransferase